jgi:FKBP-type peptidyl-prolyl cis-trans isomerase FkpA
MVKHFLKKAVFIGAAALAFSAQAADVETLPSGVRIEHHVRGDGAQPTANNSVTVHYRGVLVSTGAEFDSSLNRDPVTFSLRQVIPCWTEGLQRMASGGMAVIICPSNTAYGARGAGAAVPPNADLRFAVQLLNVR